MTPKTIKINRGIPCADKPVDDGMSLLTCAGAVFQTIYLSGAMTGLPELNYPNFNGVARALREAGHTVYNPAEYCRDKRIDVKDFPVKRAFAEYCRYICLNTDTVVMLPDWENSNGARAEYFLAKSVGCQIVLWPDYSLPHPLLTDIRP